MTNIKRLTELAGLNEYTPSTEFVTLDRAAGDALSAYQSKNNDESLEKVVQYHAMKNGVDYEDLLTTVSFYLKNPEKLMPSGVVNTMGEDHEGDETITFSVNDEAGYEAIMNRYKDQISWDGEYMVASETVFNAIGELFASMGIEEPHEVGSEDDYDGQPDERQEWGDYMGGDDWDHGQYDESMDLGKMYEEYKEQLAFEEFQNDLEEAVKFGGGTPPEERKKIQHNVGDVVTVTYPNEFQDMTGEIIEIPSHGFVTIKFDNGKITHMYADGIKPAQDEYNDEYDFDEAVRFGGDGEPPQTRTASRAAQYTKPGTFDIAKNVRTDKMAPHAKTDVGSEKPWQHEYPTGDLGASLGFKSKIDSDNFEPVVPRDFKTWIGSQGEEITANGTRDVHDKMGNLQNKSETWSTKGHHEDIVAFSVLTGSAGNFQPGTYMRSDVATPEMIQRGRNLGR